MDGRLRGCTLAPPTGRSGTRQPPELCFIQAAPGPASLPNLFSPLQLDLVPPPSNQLTREKILAMQAPDDLVSSSSVGGGTGGRGALPPTGGVPVQAPAQAPPALRCVLLQVLPCFAAPADAHCRSPVARMAQARRQGDALCMGARHQAHAASHVLPSAQPLQVPAALPRRWLT